LVQTCMRSCRTWRNTRHHHKCTRFCPSNFGWSCILRCWADCVYSMLKDVQKTHCDTLQHTATHTATHCTTHRRIVFCDVEQTACILY